MGRPGHIGRAGRLAQRVTELQFLLLLAYRPEELPENDALSVLLHTLNRTRTHHTLPLARFTLPKSELSLPCMLARQPPLPRINSDWLLFCSRQPTVTHCL